VTRQYELCALQGLKAHIVKGTSHDNSLSIGMWPGMIVMSVNTCSKYDIYTPYEMLLVFAGHSDRRFVRAFVKRRVLVVGGYLHKKVNTERHRDVCTRTNRDRK
jgi:hypothetical protein